MTACSSMLTHTFCHLPGIGLKAEQRLWDQGLSTWNDLLSHASRLRPGGRLAKASGALADSVRELESGNAEYFFPLLPAAQQWRAFSDFSNQVAYLDIETTGMGRLHDDITTIALYDGEDVRVYVRGQNLRQFRDDIRRYALLVTYNGKSFDVPIIENQLGISLPRAHIDLRYVLAGLGYKGGLKGCERQIGLARDDLDGVDGYFAVLLWQEYLRTRRTEVLETLLAYNVADVLSLEILMFHAVNRYLCGTPFESELALAVPACRANPITPHRSVIDRIRSRYGYPY